MEEYVRVSKEVFAPIAELVRIGLFRNEKDALRGIIREQYESKQNTKFSTTRRK